MRALEFGLRITTLVRDTTGEAWRDAEAKVAQMAASTGKNLDDGHQRTAVGQARLLDLADRGEVLDSWPSPQSRCVPGNGQDLWVGAEPTQR
jgi:alkanesulfonate monooxygenase